MLAVGAALVIAGAGILAVAARRRIGLGHYQVLRGLTAAGCGDGLSLRVGAMHRPALLCERPASLSPAVRAPSGRRLTPFEPYGAAR
jgi:hypothetical protein